MRIVEMTQNIYLMLFSPSWIYKSASNIFQYLRDAIIFLFFRSQYLESLLDKSMTSIKITNPKKISGLKHWLYCFKPLVALLLFKRINHNSEKIVNFFRWWLYVHFILCISREDDVKILIFRALFLMLKNKYNADNL